MTPQAIMVEQHPYGRPLGHDDYYNEIHPLVEDHPDLQALEGVKDSDANWLRDSVPQIKKITELDHQDGSAVSRGADTVATIMTEFAVDGELFQPSVDVELRDWLVETLRAQVPDITNGEIVEIMKNIRDFPPLELSERVGKTAVDSVMSL